MALAPLGAYMLNNKSLSDFLDLDNNSEKMPLLFLGHGSPMNAISDNKFVKNFKKLSSEIPKPKAIICISAHWETKGTYITAMKQPKTIHDFGGFPKALYEVQYPAPGNPDLAKETQNLITKSNAQLDYNWGLDHGSWTVIKHIYPKANIPVIQLSLDYTKPAQYHYELAKELAKLREKGVLIIGSGNMVHNLGLVAWNKLKEEQYGYDWAIEANEKMKGYILNDNHSALINYKNQGKAFQLSIPTPEHYLPLMYVLGLKESKDKITIFNDNVIGGSLNMMSLKIEQA